MKYTIGFLDRRARKVKAAESKQEEKFLWPTRMSVENGMLWTMLKTTACQCMKQDIQKVKQKVNAKSIMRDVNKVLPET